MKVKVVKFGRPAFRQYDSLCSEYYKRMQKSTAVDLQIVKISDQRKSFEQEQRILRDIDSHDRLICLDERGHALDTVSFASQMASFESLGQIKRVVFVIGGPYGLSADFRASCFASWRISGLVVTSDLAWLILSEQLYRAWTINNGIPYHHA